jgi:hypothetical protein
MYNTDAVSRFPNAWEADTREEFHVTIAYEGFGAGNSALKLYEHLQEQFGGDLDLHRTVRPLHLLQASQRAGDADKRPDMIIVASHRPTALSASVLSWLTEALTESAERPKALVALVNKGTGEQPSHLYQQLEKISSQAGATFFHHPPRAEYETEWMDFAEPRAEKGWGLNE